ncbi:TetR/AcrR family transcriptional regulator [Cohnella caldifontis]|uniref:TetR/AcrR family transcriptional regulator n=1 Tax=Cohnella caldifontis TaxID=3027471 RepID=UPI0023ECCBF9|nr:TetR/AcrR family transcriptional regulator [Cohnella sp. YIM B05605]
MRMREKQKELVRSALIQAGMKLYETQGFAKTTVDQITTTSGVAKGTFYNYFDTKEDLLVAGMAIMQAQDTSLASARVLQPDTLTEKLDRFIDWSASWIQAHPELAFIWSLERLRRGLEDHSPNSFDGQLRAIVVSGQQNGELRQDRPAEQLFLEMTALFVFAIACWVHHERQYELAAAIKDSIRTYLTGAIPSKSGGDLE